MRSMGTADRTEFLQGYFFCHRFFIFCCRVVFLLALFTREGNEVTHGIYPSHCSMSLLEDFGDDARPDRAAPLPNRKP